MTSSFVLISGERNRLEETWWDTLGVLTALQTLNQNNIHFLQANRTKEDIELIRMEARLLNVVSIILGPFEIREIRDLGLAAGQATQMAIPVQLLKRHYNRFRPSLLDSSLSPSMEVPPHPSYSDTAAVSRVVKYGVLVELGLTNTRYDCIVTIDISNHLIFDCVRRT